MATTDEILERCRQLVAKGRLPNGDVPVVLATAGRSGDPDARYVLLKEVDREGFVFYTNAHSPKGRQMAERPRAALVFYWPVLGVQLRVTGKVVEVEPEVADAYWAGRSRDSRFSALASDQSAPLPDRKRLLARVEELKREYQGKKEIPRPAHWTGYRVHPDRVEFWTGRDHRLHDRELFVLEGKAWTHTLLNP